MATDKRDIKIGDNIVDKVFKGIASARNQILGLSKSTVESRWVNEEMSSGRMRAIDSSFRIAPIVISECDIPPSVRHAKWLDMKAWENDPVFRRGVSRLLHDLGYKELPSDIATLTWSSENLAALFAISVRMRHSASVLYGAQEACQRAGLQSDTGIGPVAKHVWNDGSLAADLVASDPGILLPGKLRRQIAESEEGASGRLGVGLETCRALFESAPHDDRETRAIVDLLDSSLDHFRLVHLKPGKWATLRMIESSASTMHMTLERLALAMETLIREMIRVVPPPSTTSP